MLPSQDASCLPEKVRYIICHVGIRKNRLCFDRCLQRVLQQRWPDVKINRWFENRIYFVYVISCINYLHLRMLAKWNEQASFTFLLKAGYLCRIVWMQRVHGSIHCIPWETTATQAMTMMLWRALQSDDLSEEPLNPTCTCLWTWNTQYFFTSMEEQRMREECQHYYILAWKWWLRKEWRSGRKNCHIQSTSVSDLPARPHYE